MTVPEPLAEQAREAPAADGGWHRLHPATPVVRGWKALVVVLVVVTQQGLDDLLRAEGELPDLPGPGALLLVLGGVAAVVAVAGAWSVVVWRLSRYRLTAEELELRTGVLNRAQRSARLDRLQAVDVVQPLLARLTGLAELRLEVAGGAGSDVRLAYLREEDAARLRALLLARAAGLSVADDEEAPVAPESPLLEVPLGRLVLSLLRSGTLVGVVVFVVGLVVASTALGEPGPLLGAAPALIGVATTLWSRFSRGFGFRVRTSPDGLRLRSGLLEQRGQTVPPGRVQAVQVTQPLLWRGPDWWRVQVNVAGYGPSAGELGQGDLGSSSLLLPVWSRSEALLVVAQVLPDLGVDDPLAVVGAGLDGTGDEREWVPAPRRARWVDPVAWRRSGYRATGRALLLRRGRLQRELVLVPHEKVQSIGVRQGPLQRRLGLASVSVHSVPGPVGPRADHLDAAVSAHLVREQARRSATARRGTGSSRWMAPVATPASPADAASPASPADAQQDA